MEPLSPRPPAAALVAAFCAQLGLLGWIAGGGPGVAVGAGAGLAIAAACGRVALRRAPAAAAMLVCGGLGMTLGWWADLDFARAAAVAAHARSPLDLIWCRAPAGAASLAALPGLGHALSWMQAGMLAGGMPAVAWMRRRCGRGDAGGIAARLACAAGMSIGMGAGTLAAATIAASLGATSVVIVDWLLMSSGMLGGMAAAERVFAQRPRHTARATSAQPPTVARNPAAPA